MLATKVARQLLRGVRDRRPRDRGVRVLTYHGVIEKRLDPRVESSFHLLADFRAHVVHLRRWCRVIPLVELDEARRSRHLRPCVAITFDDGFHNNLIAADVLRAAKLPATIFVATENVQRSEPIWPTLLRLVLANGSARSLQLAGARHDLDQDPAAFARVRTLFKTAPAAARQTLWTELLSHLAPDELEELVSRFPSIAMMSWRDVASLASAGISIGSHGCLHELHHAQQSRELRLHELVSSKAQIEARTHQPCTHFAFPNGNVAPSSPEEVRSAGYDLAFTMVSRAAGPAEDAMLIPRLVPGAGLEKLISALVFGN